MIITTERAGRHDKDIWFARMKVYVITRIFSL